MTNNQIIKNEAARLAPETLHQIATAHHTPEQIAALAAKTTMTDKDGNEHPATVEDVEIVLAAAELHTYNEWKRQGKQVKKGESALISCYLWQFTTKPSKAQREAAEAEGKEAAEHPHFYPTKAYLFSVLQVEDVKAAPKGRFSSTAEIIAYNKRLAAERKAAAEKAASSTTPETTAPAPKTAPKKTSTKKAAKPAPKKAKQISKSAPVAVEIDTPVKQLDFESIAAGLLA